MRQYLNRPRSKARKEAIISSVVVVAAVAGLLPLLALGSEQQLVNLTPPSIEMGTFYGGSAVRVEGSVERGCSPVVVVRGPTIKEAFNKKGRTGPIWVNAGKIEVSGVPSLFLCFSAQPVRALLGPETITRQGLDEAGLKAHLVIEPAKMDQPAIRDEYLKLKSAEGTVGVFPSAVEMGRPAEGGTPYTVEFDWPKKAQPGTYEVSVYECRDGAILRHSTVPLRVAAVGFPAALGRLARQHGALYGIIAVLIASLAGFGMDFVTSRVVRRRARVRIRVPVPEPEPVKAAAAAGAGSKAAPEKPKSKP